MEPHKLLVNHNNAKARLNDELEGKAIRDHKFLNLTFYLHCLTL
jgi:hypothetical protein